MTKKNKSNLTSEQVIEIKKCYEDIFYFCEKYIKILTLDHGFQYFKPYDKQREMIDLMLNNRFSIFMSSRQFGKTTCVSVYLLWKAIFNSNYQIGIISDQEKHAIKIIKTIKQMIDFLPVFLKPVDEKGNLIEDNKKSLVLSNKTTIFGSSTTIRSIRGESLNCIDGSGLVTIRNKKTGKIEKISINELKNRLSQ
jgi:hypothetical protein